MEFAQPIDYQQLSAHLLANMRAIEMGQKAAGNGAGLYGYKHTSPSGTPVTSGFAHGSGGLFSTPGVEPDVYSAIPMPLRGLLSLLDFRKSRTTNPLYSILTGVTATTGSEKTNVCDDAPIAGLVKVCNQTSYFGRWERATREYELNNLGRTLDRHDPYDLRLVNNPLSNFGEFLPDVPGGVTAQNMLLSEVNKLKFELLVSFARDHARQIYSGSPTLNTAGGGSQQLVGLDIQINTGKVDAIANVACPAADSIIMAHNYGLIGSSPDVVGVFTNMYHALKQNAMITGLDPVRWVLAMRPQLFYELTAVWPCAYLTYRCLATTATINGMVDMREAVALRDAMRQGSYLLIDGEQVPVVQDMAITEENEGSAAAINQGQFASDAYFIPMTVLGGTPVTYMEYFDLDNPEIRAALGDLRLGSQFWTTNGGAILWTFKPPRNWCVQWQIKMEPRLVLRTPFVAGRITDLRYEPLRHDRDVFPTDPYFTDGGQNSRAPGGSYYTDWSVGTGAASLR